jgi:hypothetical protein
MGSVHQSAIALSVALAPVTGPGLCSAQQASLRMPEYPDLEPSPMRTRAEVANFTGQSGAISTPSVRRIMGTPTSRMEPVDSLVRSEAPLSNVCSIRR